MVKIDQIGWGKVKINDQLYHQVLIIGQKVEERDGRRLKKLFGTTHQIGKWERQKLFSGQPEIILIASGWSGLLKVDQEFKKQALKLGIKVEIFLTSQIIKKYNQFIKNKKRINALIHTTC